MMSRLVGQRGDAVRILASTNRSVMAQYQRLESAVQPNLISEPQTIEDEAHKYVRGQLKRVAPEVTLPDQVSDLDQKAADALLEQFSNRVSPNSAESSANNQLFHPGDVAFALSCLAYYVADQTTGALSSWQRNFLFAACDIAEKRPLPVMRWTEFVRSNVNDGARIRTVMRACIYSKTLLQTRISNAFIDLSGRLRLPDTLRILVIGSSGTVHYALQALMHNRGSVTILPTRPTAEHVSDYNELGAKIESINDVNARAVMHARGVDLVVIGCAVIGKTSANDIEVVNWARDIDLAKEARRQRVPVVVVGALYKIWPQSFYETHKHIALDSQRHSSLGPDATLTREDMDWLVTESEAFNFRDPDHPQLVPFMLDAKSLDVTATLSICDNKRRFIQHILDNEDLRSIDATLGGSEPTLGSVITGLENARKGDYAALRAMFERNYEKTSSLISEAYFEFPKKYNLKKDIEPGELLSMISNKILSEHEKGADARKRLAFWLAGVPNLRSPTRYLLYAVWIATHAWVTITTGLNEEKGLRAATAVVERLYARPRERNYLRRLEAT
jgi:translation initiation factor 2B subunit (eIF-2B alpha/beta/delta family)